MNQKLNDRELRFLCWKVRQGKKLPPHKAAALLDALLVRRMAKSGKGSANDNRRMPGAHGCDHGSRLFSRYERLVVQWLQRALSLKRAEARAGRTAARSRKVDEMRGRMLQAKEEYQRHLEEHCCGDRFF